MPDTPVTSRKPEIAISACLIGVEVRYKYLGNLLDSVDKSHPAANAPAPLKPTGCRFVKWRAGPTACIHQAERSVSPSEIADLPLAEAPIPAHRALARRKLIQYRSRHAIDLAAQRPAPA